jgi:hypothetical protein
MKCATFFALSVIIFHPGLVVAEEGASLEAQDPVKLVRSKGPDPDLIVREESIAGAIIRLTVVSKKLGSVIFATESDMGMASRLKRWEWKDVNGDDKPELLLWMDENFGKARESKLRILELQQADLVLNDVALIPYSRSPGQTYPPQDGYEGTLEFNPQEKTISWRSTGESKRAPKATMWTWNPQRQVFSPNN